MRIGIDCDGVLAVFEGAYNSLLAKHQGKDLRPEGWMPPAWNWEKDLGYSRKAIDAAWEEIKASESFWASLPEYGETLGILARLKEMRVDHDIYFITTRMGNCPKQQTERWLENLGYSKPTVLISAAKGPVALGLNLCYFIDDKPSNCEDVLIATGGRCSVWLLDRPWNQGYEHKFIYRGHSVHQFLDFCLKAEGVKVG